MRLFLWTNAVLCVFFSPVCAENAHHILFMPVCFLFRFAFALCVFMTWMLYLPTVESMNIIVCNFCLLCARNYSHSACFCRAFLRLYFFFPLHNFGFFFSLYSQRITQFSASARRKKTIFIWILSLGFFLVIFSLVLTGSSWNSGVKYCY